MVTLNGRNLFSFELANYCNIKYSGCEESACGSEMNLIKVAFGYTLSSVRANHHSSFLCISETCFRDLFRDLNETFASHLCLAAFMGSLSLSMFIPKTFIFKA